MSTFPVIGERHEQREKGEEKKNAEMKSNQSALVDESILEKCVCVCMCEEMVI